MRCEEARARVEEARLGLLDDDERRDFERHVGACAACRRELAEAAAFERILDLARDPEGDRTLARRLAARLAARRRRVRVLAPLAVAAALAAVALFLGGPGGVPVGGGLTLSAGEVHEVSRARLTGVAPSELVRRDGDAWELVEGAVRFAVEHGDGTFRVVTPAGTVRVLGTEFEVRIMRKSRLAAGSVAVAVLVTAGVVLFGNDHGEETGRAGDLLVAGPGGPPAKVTPEEVEDLLADRDRWREEAETLREENRRLRAEANAAAEAAAKAPAEPAPAPAPPPADVPKSLSETDWTKFAEAVVGLVNGDEQDVVKGLQQRMYLFSRARAIAAELGVDDPNDVFLHPKVLPRLADGLLGVLVPRLTPEQRAAIGRELGDEVGRRSMPERPLAVEKRVEELELAVRMLTDLSRTLTEDEVARIAPVFSTPRPGDYTVIGMSAKDRDSLARSVENHYANALELEAADRAAVAPVVRRFVDEAVDARKRLTAELGAEAVAAAVLVGPPQESPDVAPLARIRAAAGLLAPQARAERAMLEVLTPDAAERLHALGLRILWIQGG